jgi:diguanylate cyclase (GGDEF)-like protein
VKTTGLQSRIILFFVSLMLIAQLGGLALINTVGVATAKKSIGHELMTGERVFNRLLEQNNLQLAQGARILSSDYAFREALTSRDYETIVSALNNHGERINAQVMMLVDLEKIVIADTLVGANKGNKFPLPQLIETAEVKGKASAIVLVDGHLQQMVVVPVLAPVPVAWVAMGFTVDDRMVRDLERLTGLDVSFLSKTGAESWRLQATTLSGTFKAELEAALSRGLLTQAGISMLPAGDDQYVTLVSKQPDMNSDDAVVAVLQQSLIEALEPFGNLQKQLVGISLAGIFISILGSIVIARGIARPVQQLAAFARRIATGDYSNPPPITREDEIGNLSSAFEYMRIGIEARESKIIDLAYRDALTHLPNRAMFTDRLQQAIATCKEGQGVLSVLLMDVDHFKYVNDTLGHPIGDMLLCEVSNRLRSIVNWESDTVARLGGDEFAILLSSEGVNAAQQLGRNVMQALESPMILSEHMVDARVSIGIATYPEHGDDLLDLLRHADVAMYLAKRNNTGFAVYDERHDQSSAERLSLMSQLQKAVMENELRLYYQPKIPFGKQDEIYVEALIRWQHPERGFISPVKFIPFAEQTGYIKAITLWVLNRAVEQCAEWRRNGIPINVSVNISTRDLMNPELLTGFSKMLITHRCEAEWIWLELTESAILDDPDHALENLQCLRALGCNLSIDDYGTGYSSLSYLKQLPVNELKLDKSFVMGMVDNRKDSVIVRSTIDLAHNMGLKVVAEGVETQAIFDRLKEMCCDMAQGYLISKPLSAAEFMEWVSESPWISVFEKRKTDGSTIAG